MKNEDAKVKKNSKGLIIGIVAAVAIVVLGIVAWILYSSSVSYVAKVNDLKITKQEYLVFSKFNMNQFLTSISATTTEVAKYDWKTKINGETAEDQIKKSTIDNIQEIKIQLIKAKAAGIELDASDLKSIDTDIETQIQSSGSKAEAEKAFKNAYGVSLAEYKEIYKELALTQKYMTSEHSKVTVTEDEVKKKYDDNKADYDKVTASHILIATVDLTTGAPLTEGKKAEAKKKAEELLVKVKAGEDINKLAEQNSDDKPGVTENKGRYTFAKGKMQPEFEEWAFSHAIGDVGLVETDYGYHVIKLEKHEETAFADVKETIKSSLIYEKFMADFTKKMDGWKKETQFAIVRNESALAKVDISLYGE